MRLLTATQFFNHTFPLQGLSHFFFLKTHQRKYSNMIDCRASTATNDGFCTFIPISSPIQL